MADVTLFVGGHSYTVSCRDGEEERLRALARLVDAKVTHAKSSVGDRLGETRELLFAALLLADEVDEARNVGEARNNAGDGGLTERAETLAKRAEALASRLAR